MPKINTVKITIGDTEHDLTLDELKELKNILCELFPDTTVKWPTYIPIPVYEKRTYPWAPYVSNRERMWTATTEGPTLSISRESECTS